MSGLRGTACEAAGRMRTTSRIETVAIQIKVKTLFGALMLFFLLSPFLPLVFVDSIPISAATRAAVATLLSNPYSHSIVAGGLELMSYTTLLIPFTSLTILLETRSSTRAGISAQSAVIPSLLVTALRAMMF